MSEIEKVGPGKFVAYSYKLYNDADGQLLFETPADAPDVMVYGVSQEVIPGLIAAVKDLKKGDKFGATLPPAAAFGEHLADNVVELEKEIFMRDGKLAEEVKVGAMLPMMTQEGFQIAGKVIDITADHVKMDFNHPFAGLTVRYEGEIEEVREATEEELKPVHGCGSCHGGGCHGGDCGGGDCHCDGDDCGCGEGSHKHDSGCCCK